MALAPEMLQSCLSQGAEDELLEFKMAELSSAAGSLGFLVATVPFLLSLSLSLNLMHKTKFNLIRRIICLINFIPNIQAGAFPPQRIH